MPDVLKYHKGLMTGQSGGDTKPELPRVIQKRGNFINGLNGSILNVTFGVCGIILFPTSKGLGIPPRNWGMKG